MTAHIHVLTPSRRLQLMKPWLRTYWRPEGLEEPDFYVAMQEVWVHVYVGPSPGGLWTEPEWLEISSFLTADGEEFDFWEDDELHGVALVYCSSRSPCVDLNRAVRAHATLTARTRHQRARR